MKLEISNYECEKLGLEKNILLLADLFFHTFVHSKIAQKYCLDQKRNPCKFQLIIYFFCKKPNAKLFLSNFRRLSLSNLPPAKQNQTKTMTPNKIRAYVVLGNYTQLEYDQDLLILKVLFLLHKIKLNLFIIRFISNNSLPTGNPGFSSNFVTDTESVSDAFNHFSNTFLS